MESSGNSLRFGDVVTIYNDKWKGWITSGDQVVGWGLWLPKLRSKLDVPPRVRETQFKIIPKLYYSAQKARIKETKNYSDLPKSVIDGLDSSCNVEKSQNEAELKRLSGDHVHYGQIIQLFCCSSEAFVTVKKTVAKMEGQCLKVEINRDGDEGSWFQVEPAFKFRAVGNQIAYGDSIRLVSVKFKQFLHISSSSLPLQSQFFDGAHEVNASTRPSTFEIIPFASESNADAKSIVAGRVLSIKHSEMNGYLTYNPATPSRGPYWSVEEGLETEEWQMSNSLWSLESQSVEWGGGAVQATYGTADAPRARKSGYRLEHVNTGLYLTLLSSPKDGRVKLGMTDQFTSDRSLWHFHLKNEGGGKEEGQDVALDFASATPVYLRHASGVWLSRVTGEADEAVAIAAAVGSSRTAPASHALFSALQDQPEIWHGGAQLSCRKELNFTDSISIHDVDQSAMREIALLLKLMKPVQFFLTEYQARGGRARVANALPPELQAAMQGVERSEDARRGGAAMRYVSTMNPMQAVQDVSSLANQGISSLNPLRGPTPAEENPNRNAESVAAVVALLRSNVAADVSDSRKQLAKFLWQVLRGRIRAYTEQRKVEGAALRQKRAELRDSLARIREWLCPGGAAPRGWHQNTLREQGALGVLDELLRALVDAGFVLRDGVWRRGTIRETSLLVSALFAELGGGLFHILRLACAGKAANAMALRGSIGVYDLFLSTSFDAAGLLHEIFQNRAITSAFREEDVLRYAVLMNQQRRPVFVRLLRNLLSCEGRPVPANQRLVARLLFTRLESALPEVKVEGDPSGPPASQQTRILLRKCDGHGTAAGSEAAEWVDLEAFVDSYAEISQKPSSSLSESELLVVYYSEILDILRDLCCKRCTEAMNLVSASKRMCLTFDHLISTVRSERVPSEIRERLAQLIGVLYVDCEPQKVQPLIPEVRLVKLNTEGAGNANRPISRQHRPPESMKTLKEAVILFMEDFSVTRTKSAPLLKHFCELAIQMLNFGLFLSPEGPLSACDDLNRLVRVVIKNISVITSKCSKAGNDVTENLVEDSSLQEPPSQEQETIPAAQTNQEIDGPEKGESLDTKGDVLVMLGKILELALDIRTGSRMEMLISKFEKHIALDCSINVSTAEFTSELNEIKSFLGSADLCEGDAAVVTECIFRLSMVQGNSQLQALALKLLLRQLAPIKEVMDISSTLFLVDDKKSHSCHLQLRESVGKIRSTFHDSEYGVLQSDTIDILTEHLSIVLALLDPNRSGLYLVQEVQRLLNMDKVHEIIRDILKIPLGVKHIENGLVVAESTAMLQLFITCYGVLQALCFENSANQEEVFKLLPDFLDHVGIEGLNASECVIACLRKNAVLCSKIPEKILRHFLMVIIKYGKKSRWLRVLLVAMSGNGQQPVSNTQNVVLRNLEEMSELILELDGHQGDGSRLNSDPLASNLMQQSLSVKADSSTSGQNVPGDGQLVNAGSMTSEQIKSGVMRGASDWQLKRQATKQLLAREGNATRQELMLQVDKRTLQDSFLEYHAVCLETLAKCAEGNSQERKDQCQAFLSFDETLESILDLHLSPSSDVPMAKVSQDILRYIRAGFVKFLDHAYVSSKSTKSVKSLVREDSRWYSYDKKFPIEKWRNQISLMDHFLEEIEGLRSLFIQHQRLNSEKPKIMTGLSSIPLDATPIDYHWTYVFGAILPCLDRYYCNQMFSNINVMEHSRYVSRRKLYASRITVALRDLVSTTKLGPDEAKTCHNLHVRLTSLGIEAGMDLSLSAMINPDHAASVDGKMRINASWMSFIRDLASSADLSELCKPSAGLSPFCDLISAEKSEDVVANVVVGVLAFLGKEPTVAGDKLCITLLDSLIRLLDTSSATHAQFLKAGVLQTVMRLVSSTNEQIVHASVHLMWAILVACEDDAQGKAHQLLSGCEGPTFLKSCRVCIKLFFDHLKASNKERKKKGQGRHAQDPPDSSHASPRAEANEGVSQHARLACELLESLEMLCRDREDVQAGLRECEVLTAIVDFMIEAERNVLSEINRGNATFVLMLAKGFLALAAAISGPNPPNRLALTHTGTLSMMDRLLAKLGYPPSGDLLHAQLTATVRAASATLLLVLFEPPSDALAAKRVLETIDGQLFFRSWRQSRALLDDLLRALGVADSDLARSVPGHRWPSIAEYRERVAAIAGGLAARDADSAERSAALRHVAADVLNEGFLMATVLSAATDEGIFPPAMAGPLKRQEELAGQLREEGSRPLAFYADRLATVEIARGGALERLRFRVPEDCVALRADARFLGRVGEALYHELETDSDEARQAALLERVVGFSDDLLCEAELAAGPHSRLVALHPWLEAASAGLCVAANLAFLVLFESHGPGAAVCSAAPGPDLGHLGLPFHRHAPWLLAALAAAHALCAAARLASVCVQRAALHGVQARRRGAGGGAAAVWRRVAVDGRVAYAGWVLGGSLAGLLWSPFALAAPLTDLLRSPTVRLLLRSVRRNANKLGQGGLVLLLLAYAHAILGYAAFADSHQARVTAP